MALLPCVHVQQRRGRGQEQGNRLPRAIKVTGSEAESLTKQSLSFLHAFFFNVYWTVVKPYELLDSYHPCKDAST